MRRPLTTLLAAVLAVGTLVAPAAAQDAGEVTLLTDALPELLPGESAWVSTTWRGPDGATASDVRITVKSNKDVDIVYPSGRNFTSLYVDADLDAGETDVAAFLMVVKDNVQPGKQIKLDFDVSYRIDGAQFDGTQVDAKPNLRFTAADPGSAPYSLAGDTVQIAAGSVGWVHIFWRGHTRTTDFAVTSPGVEGVPVGYPEGRSDTSLWENAELAPAERDYVAMLIDATGLEPGEYALPIEVTSSVDPTEHVLTLRVV